MKRENKWAGLDGPGYEVDDLGRPGVFLLPSVKLKRFSMDGRTVEEALRDFLIANFGAYTETNVPYFGFWRDGGQNLVYDECRQYEVAFFGKERIPLLLAKLADICRIIGEDCIYVKAGQYAALVRPK